MTVYVDNMRSSNGRSMKCHMIADTVEELFQIADKIGVRRHWVQSSSKAQIHFKISLAKRRRAINMGAEKITTRELALKLSKRRKS